MALDPQEQPGQVARANLRLVSVCPSRKVNRCSETEQVWPSYHFIWKRSCFNTGGGLAIVEVYVNVVNGLVGHIELSFVGSEHLWYFPFRLELRLTSRIRYRSRHKMQVKIEQKSLSNIRHPNQCPLPTVPGGPFLTPLFAGPSLPRDICFALHPVFDSSNYSRRVPLRLTGRFGIATTLAVICSVAARGCQRRRRHDSAKYQGCESRFPSKKHLESILTSGSLRGRCSVTPINFQRPRGSRRRGE